MVEQHLPSVSLGSRLRSLREGRGLSQKALGEMVGAGQATISEIERGVQSPSLDLLCRLAQAFGVQPGYFLDEPEPQLA